MKKGARKQTLVFLLTFLLAAHTLPASVYAAGSSQSQAQGAVKILTVRITANQKAVTPDDPNISFRVLAVAESGEGSDCLAVVALKGSATLSLPAGDYTLEAEGPDTIKIGGTIYTLSAVKALPATTEITIKAGETKQYAFTFDYVPPEGTLSDSEAVAADTRSITWAKIKGANAGKKKVTSKLALPASGPNGSAIAWSSSDNSVITSSGAVTRPAAGKGDAQVTLTATVSKGGQSKTKAFNLTVKAQEGGSLSDKEAVEAGAQALSWALIRGQNEKQGDVRYKLVLPLAGENGTSIAWSSTAPSTIAPDGTVKRPASAEAGAAKATLTATIKKGSESKTVAFELTVPPLQTDNTDAAVDAKAAADDKRALGWDAIKSFNKSESQVSSNLSLLSKGPNGSTITWSSSDTSAISTDGTVRRPAAGQPGKAVVLTARIQKGSASEEVRFSLTVLAQETTPSSEGAAKTALGLTGKKQLDADRAALTWDAVKGFNKGQKAVSCNLALPSFGPNGSKIVWASSDPAVVTDSGEVLRPAAGETDKAVSLMATLSNDEGVTTLAFDITVKAEKSPHTGDDGMAGPWLAATVAFAVFGACLACWRRKLAA